MKGWNEKYVQQLKEQGKIKDYQVMNVIQHPALKEKRACEKPKAVIWLELNLNYWAKERSIEMQTEYRFHEERMWRIDFAFPAIKVGVEYEGIFGKGKSRHTTVTGYTGDTDKYNQAAALGWKIFRVTAKNYKSIIQTLNEAHEKRNG